MGDLSRNFDRKEFACECGCGFDEVSPDLVALLQKCRDRIGVPIVINSGCRCPYHNSVVGGVVNSAHTRGTAADVACNTSGLRLNLVGCFTNYFDRIGIGKTFIHVDVDTELPQEVMWLY